MVEEKLAHLETGLNKRLGDLSYWKYRYRQVWRYSSVVVAGLAALNALFVALGQIDEPRAVLYTVLALIISGLVTVLSAYEASTRPKDMFLQNAEALNQIYDIKARLAWKKLGDPPAYTEQEIDGFFQEFRMKEKEFFSAMNQVNLQESGGSQ